MSALTTKPTPSSSIVQIPLPQLVPSSACLRCDVCCRFPDPDSPLRPYFTDEEAARAVGSGVDARAFPDRSGCQIALLPDPQGEGFLCPAFEKHSGTCRIYEQRPLDCLIYPLAMMWNADHDEVLLGWDVKCPFMQEQGADIIRIHSDRVAGLLRQPEVLKKIANHPRLVGSFQEDVIVLAALPELKQALLEQWGPQPMHRLEFKDAPRFASALERSSCSGAQSLAACSPAYHYIWNALLAYWWTEIQGAFCLFIQSPDGWFMPLPPLADGPIAGVVEEAFQLMNRWNGDKEVSRIENVSASAAAELEAAGYHLSPKEPDYLYRAADLAMLAGDRHKSERGLCNRIERLATVSINPFRSADRTECRALFCEWKGQKRVEGLDPFASLLLDDVLFAHEAVWSHGSDLDLSGSVLRVESRVRAYTFGYWLSKKTWCVLVEVADRSIPGLAQYLFRDTCRKALSGGAEFINTMDDSGLPDLRRSKEAYHPLMKIQNFICSRKPRA